MHETMKKNDEKYQQVGDPAKTADILGISSYGSLSAFPSRGTLC